MPGNILGKTDKNIAKKLYLTAADYIAYSKMINVWGKGKKRRWTESTSWRRHVGRAQNCGHYLRKTFKISLKVLHEESNVNPLVPGSLQPAFFIPFRYFHKCHFLGILFRFLSSSQSLLKFHLFSVGFSYLKLWFSIPLTFDFTPPHLFLSKIVFSIFSPYEKHDIWLAN